MNKLIFDVGNTNTKVGLFKNNVLQKKWITRTNKQSLIFLLSSLPLDGIDKIVVGSVVKSINKQLSTSCEKKWKIKPFFLKMSDFSKYFNLTKFKQNSIGLDILGLSLYIQKTHKEGIGFSFGTITFVTLIKNKNILSVSFCPNLLTSYDNINNLKTAISVENIIQYKKVNKFMVGQDTASALLSGYYLMLSGLINQSLLVAKKYHINNMVFTGNAIEWEKNYVDEAVLLGYSFI